MHTSIHPTSRTIPSILSQVGPHTCCVTVASILASTAASILASTAASINRAVACLSARSSSDESWASRWPTPLFCRLVWIGLGDLRAIAVNTNDSCHCCASGWHVFQPATTARIRLYSRRVNVGSTADFPVGIVIAAAPAGIAVATALLVCLRRRSRRRRNKQGQQVFATAPLGPTLTSGSTANLGGGSNIERTALNDMAPAALPPPPSNNAPPSPATGQQSSHSGISDFSFSHLLGWLDGASKRSDNEMALSRRAPTQT